MKIAIFTDTYLPKLDGITVSVSLFTEKLLERGHSLIIFAPSYGDDSDNSSEHFKVVRFDSIPLPSYPEIKIATPSPAKLKKELEMFRADLFHFQTPGTLGQMALLAASYYGIPVTGTYHTLVSKQETYLSPYRLLNVDSFLELFPIHSGLLNLIRTVTKTAEQIFARPIIFSLCNALYDRADALISPSHSIKKELQEAGMKKPIEVISNGLNLSNYPMKEKSFPTEHFKLLHAGRLSYEKNIDIVIRAFSIIRNKNPKTTLTITGSGPAETQLQELVIELNLKDSVNFTGKIPHEKMPDLYEHHDLFLTASTMETQGLVVLEALACGLPCVGVNSHALPEIILHNENGFTADEGNFEDIAKYSLLLMNYAALYENFSRRSITIASQHDIENSVNQIIDFYDRLITK